MSVQRLQPADDGSGNLELADTVWQDSDGTAYADVVESMPGGALPGVDPVDESARQHGTLEALVPDLAAAMGGNVDLANAIVADLEGRIDAGLLSS